MILGSANKWIASQVDCQLYFMSFPCQCRVDNKPPAFSPQVAQMFLLIWTVFPGIIMCDVANGGEPLGLFRFGPLGNTFGPKK